MAIRINPAEIAGTTTATGDANAFGPYRFRGGHNIESVRVGVTSTNTTDVFKIIFLEPGVTPTANADETPIAGNYPATTGLTAPFSIVINGNEMGGNVDIYVVSTTQTGVPVIKIQKVQGF